MPTLTILSCTRLFIALMAVSFALTSCSKHSLYTRDRVQEWGTSYFDHTDAYDNYGPQILDTQTITNIIGADFTIKTPFYVNNNHTIDCMPVEFGDALYWVGEPFFVGSKSRNFQGFDFYIRHPENPSSDTDVRISVFWNQYLSMKSVVYDFDLDGERIHKQMWTTDTTRFGAEDLASKTRKELLKALGDNNEDDFLNMLPLFAEKWVLVVDNAIVRDV